jgi:hypothetical protein
MIVSGRRIKWEIKVQRIKKKRKKSKINQKPM